MYLGSDARSNISSIQYYNFACAYSLNKEQEKALKCFEESFISKSKNSKKSHVTVEHLVNDKDLDFIRSNSKFKAIVRKFYSDTDYQFILINHEFNNKQEISYEELLQYFTAWSSRTEIDLVIENKTIYWKKSADSVAYNSGVLEVPKFNKPEKASIKFSKCKFQLNFAWFSNSPTDENFYSLTFTDCEFLGRSSFSGLRIKNYFFFKKCIFNSNLQMSSYLVPRTGYYSNYGLDSCSLRSIFLNLWGDVPINIQISNNKWLDSTHVSLFGPKVSYYDIINNDFNRSHVQISAGEVESLAIERNHFNSVELSADVKSEFVWGENTLASCLVLEAFKFPKDAGSIIWDELDGMKLGLIKSGSYGINVRDNGEYQISYNAEKKLSFVTGKNADDVSNRIHFYKLMSIYSMFLSFYKENNNVEMYNACFIQTKELQSKRLMYLYDSKKSFEAYFRWKLSQLLKFYVRHGTDPARAIVISIYIILCFGIFFFFFPSDWDKTSKGKLVQNFKDFIQKNEKGYIKPFFILLWGFIISLLNAVTLSLNAFITLGFGNIPTHGVARYVCVLEGFMGWFLLSIFTVAMINQVL